MKDGSKVLAVFFLYVFQWRLLTNIYKRGHLLLGDLIMSTID